MKLIALDQRWTLARCQFTLMCATAFIDLQLSVDEEQELLALAARTRTLHALSKDVIATMFDEVRMAHQNRSLAAMVDKALADLPKDPEVAVSVYAHCVDIALADRRAQGSERSLLAKIARTLRIDRNRQRLVDKVLDWKNEAQ